MEFEIICKKQDPIVTELNQITKRLDLRFTIDENEKQFIERQIDGLYDSFISHDKELNQLAETNSGLKERAYFTARHMILFMRYMKTI